jgi:hypothetical protein
MNHYLCNVNPLVPFLQLYFYLCDFFEVKKKDFCLSLLKTITSANVNTTKPKISELNMAAIREKHVVWLHITMNNTMPENKTK